MGLSPGCGILNFALSKIGIEGPKWLQDPKTALTSLIIMSLWGIGGGRMLIFLAGLQGISDELYEAAQLDECKGLDVFPSYHAGPCSLRPSSSTSF